MLCKETSVSHPQKFTNSQQNMNVLKSFNLIVVLFHYDGTHKYVGDETIRQPRRVKNYN